MTVKTIEMIRAIRDQQYEETKDITIEERLIYFQRRAQEFRNRLAAQQHSTARSTILKR